MQFHWRGGITRLLLEIVHKGWDPVNRFNTLVGWLSLSQLTVLSQTYFIYSKTFCISFNLAEAFVNKSTGAP